MIVKPFQNPFSLISAATAATDISGMVDAIFEAAVLKGVENKDIHNAKHILNMVITYIHYELPSSMKHIYQIISILNSLSFDVKIYYQNNLMNQYFRKSAFEVIKRKYAEYTALSYTDKLEAFEYLQRIFAYLGYDTHEGGNLFVQIS